MIPPQELVSSPSFFLLPVGKALLWGSLVLSVLSFIGYVTGCFRSLAARRIGRGSFLLSALLCTAASAYLMELILGQHYEVVYVFSNTSRVLPFLYRFSAFWAGPEGSFLLWALFGCWAGVLFLLFFRASPSARSWEPFAMAPYSLGLVFLFWILVKQSPFLACDQKPFDGAGLNPLLEDPWMAIHPPLIFLGYAFFAAPYSLAIAAMIRGEFREWVNWAFPWTLAAVGLQGLGIFLGGYWAYKVLGWGGYWGWDPVENASLIPWLTGLALVHGLLVQRVANALIRTNFVLAILSFVLVIYGSFLTRSGVLADFSVHSFGDVGLMGVLLLFLAVFLAGGLFVLALRASRIPGKVLEFPFFSRVSLLYLAIVGLCISAFLIAVGTSWPILTGLAGKASSMKPDFYVRTQRPVGLLLSLLILAAPLLKWTRSEPKKNLFATRKSFFLLLACGLGVPFAGCVTAFFLNLKAFVHLALLFLSLAALESSAWVLWKVRSRGFRFVGGYLAHLGVAAAFVGFLASSTYEEEHSALLALIQEHPQEAMGYTFTFKGKSALFRSYRDEKGEERILPWREAFLVEVVQGERLFYAYPSVGLDPNPRRRVASPHIERGLLGDLYIKPGQYQPPGQAPEGNEVLIEKGATVEFKGVEITFRGFSINQEKMREASHGEKGPVLDLLFEFSLQGQKEEMTLSFAMGEMRKPINREELFSEGEKKVFVSLKDVSLKEVTGERPSAAILQIEGLEEEESPQTFLPAVFHIEVIRKPLVWLVWLGTVLVTLGFLVAAVRRSASLGRSE